MQIPLDFGDAARLREIRRRLLPLWEDIYARPRRTPIGQLVKSLISSRTKDAESLAVYERLIERCPRWSDITAMPLADLVKALSGVTFPEPKAEQLQAALHRIMRISPDFDLDFLAKMPVAEALALLEQLAGVGPKVAASVLNFSTLQMPSFVVDEHVRRVLCRFGLVRPKADVRTCREFVTATLHEATAEDFRELHILLKRLGQVACHAGDPNCRICPLADLCRAGRHASEHNGRLAAGPGR